MNGVSRIVAETHEGSFGTPAASARLRGGARARHSDLRNRIRGRSLRGGGRRRAGKNRRERAHLRAPRAWRNGSWKVARRGETGVSRRSTRTSKTFARSWRNWKPAFCIGSQVFKMMSDPPNERDRLRRRDRREGGAQTQGAAQSEARRLVRPRHDGTDRLVGDRADLARRRARHLVGQALSRHAFLDARAPGRGARQLVV